ncbi:hypothetical protein Hanom_Chr02g00098241 [Helianthus anomalus]
MDLWIFLVWYQMRSLLMHFVDAAGFGSTRFGSTQLGSAQDRCHDIPPSCAPEIDPQSTKSRDITSS